MAYFKKAILAFAVTAVAFIAFAQSGQKKPLNQGSAYLLNSDNYIPIKYTKVYSHVGAKFFTKYTIYHPTKGYAWITVLAEHDKDKRTVKVKVDDTNEGIFSHINDEETTYDTATLEAFGYRGTVGALAGKRVPNQLMLKFSNNKYESVNVINVLAAQKGDLEHSMYFLLK